ncbi:PPC domain-containing protein [Acinetobacter variabilis]|uniref:PPC domain-containing protein n=1 Tax=Acinetobacter variabilis TaxID=70346 RepID=UPI003A86F06C
MEIANTKLIAGALIALTLTIVSPVVLANDNNNIRKTIVVKFAKKAYSANYYGKIDGYKYDSYKFYAKKGQKLKVKLTGGNVEAYLWSNQLKDSINLGEYSPELDDKGIYILPASGEYEIRVLQPRSQASKDKKPQYWMSINIK